MTMPLRASASDSDGVIVNVEALVGIAKPARASASNGINAGMNAEALAGFAPKDTTVLLEACS